VQRSSSREHPYWFDTANPTPLVSRKQTRSDDDDDNDNGSGNDENDRDTGVADNLHTIDPDLRAIAKHAIRHAKRREMKMQKMQSAIESMHIGRDSQTRPSLKHTDGSDAYLSFEDNVLLQRLSKTHWDARYGILKLIPFALFTN
jgi:hypothetical protein